MSAVVAVDGVTVRYGRRTAVEKVSFNVARGSTVALLGRNGAGKTSLVRCLLGQQRPEGGTVRIFGREVWRERVAVMERVGVVPEGSDLPPEVTAEALLGFLGALYRA